VSCVFRVLPYIIRGRTGVFKKFSVRKHPKKKKKPESINPSAMFSLEEM